MNPTLSTTIERRELIKTLGALGVGLVIPALGGCGASVVLALKPWSGPPAGEHDARLSALGYALLAPSSHNTQPWALALRGSDSIDVYVDRTRLLPKVDPLFRQSHVSQGTFLELLVIALLKLGYSPELEYFPQGEYESTVIEDRPVAGIRLAPGSGRSDPLFAQIRTRRTNKYPYAPDRRLSRHQIDALVSSVAADGPSLRVVVDPAARKRLVRLCVDGMTTEIKRPARNAETAAWFRFSDRELEEKRDGFGLEDNGVTGFKRWFAETFILSRESAADPTGTFATGAVDMTQEQAESAAAFGILTTSDNTRLSQVKAGRAYTRIALTAQALGLAMQPMSQALEEYPDMAEVKARFEHEVALSPGATAQMFFRLGYADEVSPHTPRRDVHDLLRST